MNTSINSSPPMALKMARTVGYLISNRVAEEEQLITNTFTIVLRSSSPLLNVLFKYMYISSPPIALNMARTVTRPWPTAESRRRDSYSKKIRFKKLVLHYEYRCMSIHRLRLIAHLRWLYRWPGRSPGRSRR